MKITKTKLKEMIKKEILREAKKKLDPKLELKLHKEALKLITKMTSTIAKIGDEKLYKSFLDSRFIDIISDRHEELGGV